MNPMNYKLSAPLIVNYLVMLCNENKHGGMMSDGEPVFTDYTKLDWKGLASGIQAHLSETLPANIKVFVWNDGQDVLDIVDNGNEESRWLERSIETTRKLDWTQYRGGVCNVSKNGALDELLHFNPITYFDERKRPPLTTITISLKYPNTDSFVDYHYTAGLRLFGDCIKGKPNAQGLLHSMDEVATLPPTVKEWLQSSFGVEDYGDKCAVFMLPIVRQS